jgi:hypothetical protein
VPDNGEEVVLRSSKPAPRADRTTLRGTAPPAPTVKRVVPRILRTDIGGAKLAPGDAYLLSRIDGVLALEDLADLTGRPAAEILEKLGQLAKLGLVRF